MSVDDLERALNIADLEALAAEALPRLAYDYYRSGSHDELTLRENAAAFGRLKLRYRVMVDVSRRDLSTRALGAAIAAPLIVAPTTFHRMACPEGELATARAAGAEGSIMILSTLSNTAVEAVVEAATGPVWFQLYIYRDRAATRALVQRAEAAGVEALVLTVDAPLLGTRERDVRNRFHLPEGLRVENMTAAGMGRLEERAGESGLAAYVAELLDPALTWADLEWLASISRLPVIVKGIVRGDDAARAVDHGAAGVVVSNHGGRQLDTSVATIDALPEVVEALSDRVVGAGQRPLILLDGGVRRGTDVLKAVALGASAVLVFGEGCESYIAGLN